MRTMWAIFTVAAALVFSSTTPVYGATGPVGAGTWDNDSDSVTLSGDWTTKSSNQDFGGSYAQLTSVGYAQISFTTSGIKWTARKSSSSGIAEVYLDGAKVATVDLYAASTQYRQTVYEVSGLPETAHTLRVVRTGTKSANSIGSNVTVDTFVTPDIYPPATPAGLSAKPESTGIRLTWNANSDADLAGYRLYRTNATTTALVQDALITGTSLLDFGLTASTTYSYSLVAVDKSQNVSPQTSAVRIKSAARAKVPSVSQTDCPAATITPSNGTELKKALSTVGPGDVIRLAANTVYSYPWYTLEHSGTVSAPIWICGPTSAVIDAGTTSDGRGLRLDGVDYVNVVGFSVQNAAKGIQVRSSSHVLLSGLNLSHIGDEAIHLLDNTTDSYVVRNVINGTGVAAGRSFYGEGVYVGTARENRCKYSGCSPDKSDRNVIALNEISNTSSETIEVKAGASDGWIYSNTLNADGMSEDHPAALVMMGDRWIVDANTVSNANVDAIQDWTAENEPQFGNGSQFFNNKMGTSPPNYAVRIGDLTSGNMVGCNGGTGKLGLTNVACQR